MQDSIQISGLEPLLAPDEIGAWPPAPGWYLLAFLLLSVLIYLLIRMLRKRKRNRYRFLALKQLAGIREQAGNRPVQEDLRALNRLLKLTALAAFPRVQVASLSGQAWQEFLDEVSLANTLENHQWELLCYELFRHPDRMHISLQDWEVLLSFSNRWIRKHNKPLTINH